MIKVKEINAEMTYELRHQILRPHQPVSACQYDTDHHPGTFHVGAFSEDKLISIASFNVERNDALPFEKHYRLRAMATLDDYRMLGAGRRIVSFAEDNMKGRRYQLLWCNGRTTVQAYYEKLGFRAYGSVFDYPPIGPHIVLAKELV